MYKIVFLNHSDSLFIIEFFTTFCYALFALFLSFIIISVFFFTAIQKPESEKLSTYECGFEPYNDSRSKFDIKFYLLAIIFIVFDLETMFLLPWSITLSKLNILGVWAMIDFIFELGFVYFYIWSIGALDWE